jgi:hypothetical protein
MPIEALIVSATAWGLAALTLLGTVWAAARLQRPKRDQLRLTLLASLLPIAWLMLTAILAAGGMLSDFSRVPAPFMVFIVVCFVLTLCVAFSGFGRFWALGLPFSALIGFQAFRILAELLLYFAYQSGLAPVQMTFEGYNWDILTGVTALPMAWWVHRHPDDRRSIWIWNVLGLALLVTIVTIAMLSAPTPMRVFMNEPANTFVTTFPYVWLPAVLVMYALLGHVLVFRKLSETARGAR